MNNHLGAVSTPTPSLAARSVILGIVVGACQSPETASVADSGSAPPTPSPVPAVAATHYRLVAVDSLLLPDSATCGASIATAGELTLRENGTWTASERAQYHCAQPASVVTDSGTFAWTKEKLELRSLVDAGAHGVGWGRGDTLRVDFGVDAVYVYVRTSPVE